MLYQAKKREQHRQNLAYLSKHPYFGFLLVGLGLLLIQLLYGAGVVSISVVSQISQVIAYIVVGLGFSILLGYGGLASLGTAGFVGLGTYVLGYFNNAYGFPFFLSLIIALGIAILIGGVVGMISLRIEGMYLAIITLALSEIFVEIFKNAIDFTNGTNGLLTDFTLFGMEITPDLSYITYLFLVVILMVTMVITLNIMKSPTGRAMLAMKNSDSAAQAMGISIFKYRLIAFILSTVYAVVGGMLYMGAQEFTIPDTWSLAFSLNVLAAIIVGGPKSIYGVILGTFMIFGFDLLVLREIQFFLDNPNITLIFNGLLIVVVVMFYPGGLVRLLENLKVRFMIFVKRLRIKWKEYHYGKDDEQV